MASSSAEARTTPAPENLLSRFLGIITSPKATFENVVAHPRWFGMLALVTLTMAALVGGFMLTTVGQEAWLDAATTSPFAGEISDDQYAGMQRMAPVMAYVYAVVMLITIPLMMLVIAAILFAVFNAAMGGDATFQQLFTVVVHASAISVLGQLFTVPINYARGSMTSATNLAVLLPMIDESSFMGRLLGMIDLFVIWWVVVLAIGLGVLYRRRTQPIATTLFVIYGIIAVVAAAILSRVGGA